MSNLAELALQLSNSEEEKNKAQTKLQSLQKLRYESIVGIINFQLSEIDGVPKESEVVELRYSTGGSGVTNGKTEFHQKKNVSINVQSETTELIIYVTLATKFDIESSNSDISAGDTLIETSVNLPISAIISEKEEKSLSTTLELKSTTIKDHSNYTSLVMNYTFSYVPLDEQLELQTKNVEVLEERFKEHSVKLREAKKALSQSQKGSTKEKKSLKDVKKKAATSGSEKSKANSQATKADSGTTANQAFSKAIQVGMFIINIGLENRAYIMFGLSAVGIYFYGDMASV
eukprot:gene9658-13002_t